MAKKNPRNKKKSTTDSLSDRRLFELASELESAKKLAAKYEKDPKIGWRAHQSKIVAEMKRRGVKSLVDAGLMKITMVAAETVVYDDEGMWAEMTAAKRRMVFDRQINLGRLSAEDQKALLSVLTPAQRKRVVSHSLNVDRLAEAVQGGKIEAEWVAKFSELKESTPYVVISHGEVE